MSATSSTRKGHPRPDEQSATGLQLMQITETEFNSIRDLVYSRFGIKLGAEKRSLVVGRLQKVLHSRGFNSFQEYYDFVVGDASGQAIAELAARISTNHTFFYRESDHFDFFVKTALPEVVSRHQKRNDRDLRIWCAGCSSGEEPYTLVMLMKEYFGLSYKDWNAGVLATDISPRALASAKAGLYTSDRIEPLPEALRRKYFRSTDQELWQIDDGVKREVTLRSLNLMNRSFPFKRPFDIIFCRNVMIYFDQPTREQLVQRFTDNLVPGGYLFIGHSESLRREVCPLDYVMPALYRKREG